MKKVLALLLSAAMVLSMAACGNDSGTTTAADSGSGTGSEATTAADSSAGTKGKIAYVVGNLGDQSFNDSGNVGIEILKKNGYEANVIETGGDENADKYSDYIYDAIEKGGATYIVTGSTYQTNVETIAKEFPDLKFVLFDMPADYTPASDNITAIYYAQNQGSYLVGMVAAGMSKTGVIAVNIGKSNPVISDFMTGFVEGATAYNPDIKIVSSEVGDWVDAAKMKSICESQYRDYKADVYYQVAGGAGSGVFLFCSENEGTWAIGVDSDQYAVFAESENPEYADTILTSMLKEVGNSLVDLFAQIEKGEDIWGQIQNLGLEGDYVSYVNNDFYQANVPEEIRTAVEEAKAKIASGDIVVKSYYDFASQSEFEAYMNSYAP